jgi:hypothetical protein
MTSALSHFCIALLTRCGIVSGRAITPFSIMSRRHNEFEKAAAREGNCGFMAELWGFLKDNRKWWLLPILVLLLALGLLTMLAGSGAAPFIYSLF